MASPPLHSSGRRLGPISGALAFILLFLSTDVSLAGPAPPVLSGSTASSHLGAGRPSPPLAVLPLAEGWSIGKLWSGVRAGLGNRRRMLQVATIGMCIGLYIMMRK